MFKNKVWLGIILLIILMIFSINGFTAYYKYTQESGDNFYVGTGDKADALEDTNEIRQIIDDLGALLAHSKRNDLYPKDGTTGGYLGRLNSGLDASKPAVPVVNDMYLATDTTKVYKCFVAGNWVQVYPSIIENNVTKTGAFTAGRIAKINNASGIIEQGTNTDTDVADAVTKKHTSGGETCAGDVSGTVGTNTVDKIKGHTVDETDIGDNKLLVYKTTGDKYVYEILDLSLYYLKTEIDTLSKVETIYTKNIIDSDELAALKFTDLTDTPATYNNGKYAKSTADGVVWDDPAGAGDMTKAVYDTDTDNIVDKAETVDDGVGNSSTAADIKDTVTKKHTQGTDTDLDATFEASFVKKADTVNVLSDITSAGADIEDAVTKKHTQNTDTAAGGEWDFGAHSAGFTIQTAGGDGTTTIDWTAGNYFKFTHGAMPEIFTFDPAPTKPSHLTLIIIQDGVGGRDSTWPAPVKWLGDEPTWTDGGANKGIVVAMVYDGTNYWSQGTPWEE